MSGIGNIGGNFNYSDIASASGSTEKSGWAKFGKVLGGIASNLPAVGGALAGVGVGGSSASFDRQMDMIKLQQQIQEQTQIINTVSNISKAKHEAAMTAIRNFK